MLMQSHISKIIAAALLTTAVLAAAQSKPDEQPQSPRRPQANRDRGERPALAGGPARFAGLERIFGVLTEDQRASLREAMQGQREKMRELEEKLRDARKEIFLAGLKEKFDEETVRQKAVSAANLDAELTVLRAKAFSQMRPPLSAEQIEKLKNLPPPGVGESQSERPRRRPDIQRDEHGLPLKDKTSVEPKRQEPAPK
jgi:Spy/CpxP family protein refolding chaperone